MDNINITTAKEYDISLQVDDIRIEGKIKVGENGIKLAYSTFTEVPQVFDFSDMSGMTNMNYMFAGCESLTTIPEMNTSEATDMYGMFWFCRALTSIPALDTSKVTTMNQMFYYCQTLTTMPPLNTSNVTDMHEMFCGCSSLTTIPLMNTSRVTDMEEMFYRCESLITVPAMDTSKVTTMLRMFEFCRALTTIPEMDASNVTDANGMLWGCSRLTDLGGFVGLKAALDVSSCTALTHNSLMNIINKVGYVTMSPKTLKLGSTNLAKLSDEEKAVATGKGWILA